MTLVEILIAMVMLVVIFSAVVPQLRSIQNSWASKKGNAELIQNGRDIVDHINFNLSQAKYITAVSDSAQTAAIPPCLRPPCPECSSEEANAPSR